MRSDNLREAARNQFSEPYGMSHPVSTLHATSLRHFIPNNHFHLIRMTLWLVAMNVGKSLPFPHSLPMTGEHLINHAQTL